MKSAPSYQDNGTIFDADMTVSADFDLNAMLETLQRCNTNSFWEMP
jgi:hypothetical protein